MTDDDPIQDWPTLGPGTPTTPPTWARMQRELLAAAEDAAIIFVDRYSRPDGTLPWRQSWPGIDGSDDPYEAFQGLPMLYLLGGSERLLHLAHRQWEAVTRQWTGYGQIHREYDGSYDWMHHGEADNLFRLLGMADPTNTRHRQRAVRFAGFYTGEDPAAPNYDRARRLIRSPLTGSRGPKFTVAGEDWSTHRDVFDAYPPPFEDIPGVDGSTCAWTDDTVLAKILDRMNARMTCGDVPLNLTATSLLTHAYLLTDDDRYRRWVLDYHDAWRERTARNGGVIPDNVGPDDLIGQYMNGRWWGGYYGWRWPHGAPHILEAVAIGSSNAALLDRNTRQLDLIRSQLDALWALGRWQNGTWRVPVRRLDGGWTDYRPARPNIPIACWSLSHEEADLDRVLRHPDSWRWGKPTSQIAKGNGAANSEHWFAYIQGQNPDYPTQILETNHQQMLDRLDEIRHDDGDPADWEIHHWQMKSPIFVEGLVQLTLGAPMHLYHGGLQHATVRYHDSAAGRPGLPPDVAALVDHVDDSNAVIHLVNCGRTDTQLTIQAGAYGEHLIAEALTGDSTNQHPRVDRSWLAIHLQPQAQLRLQLTLRRFVNTPSYAGQAPANTAAPG